MDLATLIDDINLSSTEQYSFIKVLEPYDRVKFVAVLTNNDILKIYNNKGIELNLYIQILKFLGNYRVYRRAYWGEKSYRKRINNNFTHFLIPLWDNNNTKIDLLLNNNNVYIVDKNSIYTKLDWKNVDYNLPNEIYM